MAEQHDVIALELREYRFEARVIGHDVAAIGSP